MQFHTFVLATFASLIAPFGGFFASGIKRTFKIKDFGDSIPGHGGMTDRMDCQFIMGTLMFMYYQGFIAMHKATVGGVMEMAIAGLSLEDQVEVVRGLSHYLVNQGAIPHAVRICPYANHLDLINLNPGTGLPHQGTANEEVAIQSIFRGQKNVASIANVRS